MAFERYTSPDTSLEVRSRLGPKFFIRSFCDDPLGGIYEAKPPVCKLKLNPTAQFANENIAWDISESDSATGTVDTFTITWGGTTDIGNISGDSFGVDPESGNVQFTTAGTYVVTAYVVDTLGARSKEQEIEVTILPDGLPSGSNDRAYVGTTDGGLYIISPVATNAQSNTGLTGNHANFRALRLHPIYRDREPSERHLWAATQDGIAYSTDGGANWSVISKATLGDPANDAGDGPAPVTADLDQIDLWFDPQDQDTIYVLRTTATRVWLYKTTDYGATWTNVQVKAE